MEHKLGKEVVGMKLFRLIDRNGRELLAVRAGDREKAKAKAEKMLSEKDYRRWRRGGRQARVGRS